MSDAPPDGIELDRASDLRGRHRHVWYRRGLLCLVALLPLLALLNVFGQRPTVTSANASAAELQVTAPQRLRSGLIFQARVEVTAHRDIAELQLVFDRGWWESMSVNSIEPNPGSESTANGRVTLTYDKLAAGQTLIVWLYFQVNPTNVGHRREDVALDDGPITLARVHRTLTVFP